MGGKPATEVGVNNCLVALIATESVSIDTAFFMCLNRCNSTAVVLSWLRLKGSQKIDDLPYSRLASPVV